MRNNEQGNDGPIIANGKILGFHRTMSIKRDSGIQYNNNFN